MLNTHPAPRGEAILPSHRVILDWETLVQSMHMVIKIISVSQEI